MTTAPKKSLRSAIYTRKSSEEGLDQSFNSLDAQREACQAYILSQRHEGWRAIETSYDDGGYSGGSMERPGLKQLLADVRAHKIDIVLVYKVDRLTRSLADFAKIVEVFDACDVSFVSVTQQFNTTSSMGRLTLNVLLSFAQFEREVTGERIRDKIAASKRKGMWMGGPVALGYDLKDQHLVVNKAEAERVRQIFQLYLKFGCVRRLKFHLDDTKIKSKVRISRAGNRSGGAGYSRGALYKILENRLYLGEIPHKQQWYPGTHEAIVNEELWQAVQAKLAKNAVARRDRPNCKDPSLLTGILFNESGKRFTPSHAVKKGKRYRYYVLRPDSSCTSGSKQLTSIPAHELEGLVLVRLKKLLLATNDVVKLFSFPADDVATTRTLVESAQRTAQQLEVMHAKLSEFFRLIAFRVMVHPSSMELQLRKRAVRSYLLGTACPTINDARTATSSEKDLVTIRVAATVKRCGGEMRLVIPGTSAPLDRRQPALYLLKAVARGHEWVRLLEAGKLKDQRAVAAYAGLDERYIARILPCAFLAPTLVEAILQGRQSADLSIDRLLKHIRPNWEQQRVPLEHDLGLQGVELLPRSST